MELIFLKAIQQNEQSRGKKWECTAGGRGEKTGELLSPEAFFQATRANFETTPSVTDRDVNTSVPKQSRTWGHPSSPKAPAWLPCTVRASQAGGGGLDGVLLRTFWMMLRAALGTSEGYRGGQRNTGRKEGAAVTEEVLLRPALLRFPQPRSSSCREGVGKEKERPDRLTRGAAPFLELCFLEISLTYSQSLRSSSRSWPLRLT